MKTQKITSSLKSLGFLTALSLFLVSCGSFSQASFYAQDGIYSNQNNTAKRVVSQNSPVQQVNENHNEFGSYFSERANTYATLLEEDNFTTADQYSSSEQYNSDQYAEQSGQTYRPQNTQNSSLDQNGQAGWGSSPSAVTIQVHNNPWFDSFYGGGPFFNNIAMGGPMLINSPRFRSWRNWRFNRWGFGYNPWGMSPWGISPWGGNFWGGNQWGWGFNAWHPTPWYWNNNVWSTWGFQNPVTFYGPYNYARVNRFGRYNRFNRGNYRTNVALNASRRGKSNQTRRNSSSYALKKNTLNVNGLRNYLRTSNNTSVVDAYRTNARTPDRANSLEGSGANNLRRNISRTSVNGISQGNARTRSSVSNGSTRTPAVNNLSNNLRRSSYNTANSVRNNSVVRTPRATRSNSVRSTQSPNQQLYRNLAPRASNFRSVGPSRNSIQTRQQSPIRRSVAPKSSTIKRTSNNRSSSYRSSSPSRRSSSSVRSSSSTRSSSSSGRSSSSSRSNGKRN